MKAKNMLLFLDRVYGKEVDKIGNKFSSRVTSLKRGLYENACKRDAIAALMLQHCKAALSYYYSNFTSYLLCYLLLYYLLLHYLLRCFYHFDFIVFIVYIVFIVSLFRVNHASLIHEQTVARGATAGFSVGGGERGEGSSPGGDFFSSQPDVMTSSSRSGTFSSGSSRQV